MNENTKQIIALYDGIRSSAQISKIVGFSSRYVRKVATRLSLDRLHCGAQPGKENHQFVYGRRIDHDGYARVTAPTNHPYALHRPNRPGGHVILEHRLVKELEIGRYLLPLEIVDHKDGLTLHNAPSNLRLFSSNGEHLNATLTERPKLISESGRQNIKTKIVQKEDFVRVDIYYRRRVRGDIRLRQILLLALSLGIDSPFLLGTHRHLEKAGIDPSSHSMIEHALAELEKRWAQDLSL